MRTGAICRDGYVVCPMGKLDSSGRVDTSGERCINESFVCDGYQDCVGGTDEMNCTGPSKIFIAN